MTHIGRPKDKKTGQISCKPGESVGHIVKYLQEKLSIRIGIPECPIDPQKGIPILYGAEPDWVPFLAA